MIGIKTISKASVLLVSALIAGLTVSGHAFAFSPTMGESMDNLVQNSSDIPELLSAFSYMCGIVLAFLAIVKLKDHVINPNQTPMSDSIKRFLAGGAFFALPTVAEAAQNAFGQYFGGGLWGDFNATPTGAVGGLDDIMVNMMTDIWPSVNVLISVFCYLAGLILVIIGISRLLKTSQEGARGPAGFGTMMTFLVGGILLSFDAMLGAFSESFFNNNGNLQTFAVLQFSDNTTDMTHVNNVIAACLAFMIIVGLISFVRGWFIIRDVAEGNHQASLMAGMTHIFGGALAVNLGPVLNAVQLTFGLQQYGIIFS
ncbi:MAG: hypothetical protein JWO78_599 [Micavibrio sp.]|nr:hypothetical protein [Micavibrio sp.]